MNYRKILVPLDGSELGEAVLPHVETVARGCNVVKIVLMQVLPPLNLAGDFAISQSDRERIEKMYRSEAQTYLDKTAGQLREHGFDTDMEIIPGRAAEAIVDYAENHEVDLIMLATHGRSGVARWALGSTADRVIRLSCIPVFVVRPPACAPGP